MTKLKIVLCWFFYLLPLLFFVCYYGSYYLNWEPSEVERYLSRFKQGQIVDLEIELVSFPKAEYSPSLNPKTVERGALAQVKFRARGHRCEFVVDANSHHDLALSVMELKPGQRMTVSIEWIGRLEKIPSERNRQQFLHQVLKTQLR